MNLEDIVRAMQNEEGKIELDSVLELGKAFGFDLEEILSDDFIKANTSLNSLDELLDKIGISRADISLIFTLDGDQIDLIIREVSDFENLQELVAKGREYLK